MTERPIEEAPKDRHVLLIGPPVDSVAQCAVGFWAQGTWIPAHQNELAFTPVAFMEMPGSRQASKARATA